VDKEITDRQHVARPKRQTERRETKTPGYVFITPPNPGPDVLKVDMGGGKEKRIENCGAARKLVGEYSNTTAPCIYPLG
jgi:hypothetical protein